MRKRLFILDGSSLMFRAFYALPLLSSASGVYTNAIYGFSNMLLKLLKDWKPDEIAVAFDKSRHTFRTDIYPEYKGNRDKTPEEFVLQIPLLKELLSAWGISFIELDNYEADDIIGTIAKRRGASQNYEVFVVTGDRDALQLIDENIKVIFTKKGISETVVYDVEVFEEEYGFEPLKLIDLKGLMGDSSDNIPGVPGVGPKTATKLLVEYKSLEGVLENASSVSGKKLQEKLIENTELAVLSKRLATIDCNIPFDTDGLTLRIDPNIGELTAFCQKYNLKSVLKLINELYTSSLFDDVSAAQELTYIPLDNDDAYLKFSAELTADTEIAVSALFSSKVPNLEFASIAVALGEKLWLAVDSQMSERVWNRLLEHQAECLFWDAKMYFHAGKKLPEKYIDVKLAAYLADPEATDYSLDRLAVKYGFTGCNDVEEMLLPVWEAKTIAELQKPLFDELSKKELVRLYYEIELPLIEVLAEMESVGIYVNSERLAEQSKKVSAHIDNLQAEIFDIAKEKFNINSPKQLGRILFEKLGLPALKKTKTGYSTNADVLNELRGMHPIIERILAFRVWSKLKSTYLDALPELIDERTGRIHTSFNQMVTATGRLSSSEPNLQNIPVRKEEGRELRNSFEPGTGYDYIMSADYSQIELRVLAHLSQDNNFLSAYKKGEDIHIRTAAEVFGVEPGNVTAEQRRRAKAVNFGIVYGISDYGLAQDLGITRNEAREYIKKYFEACSGVKEFIDKTVTEAHKNSFVKTMFGRRRDLLRIHSKNFNQRSLAERMAMNTPVQGSAADIIKLAMIAVSRALREYDLRSRVLLQVHDELVLEVPEDEKIRVEALVKECMENVVSLTVPLEVDIHFGKNWAEAK